MIIEKPSVGAASLQSILASRGKALVSEKELAALTELQANFDSLQMTIEWFSEEAARSRRQERMKRMLGDPLGFDPSKLVIEPDERTMGRYRSAFKGAARTWIKANVAPLVATLLDRAFKAVVDEHRAIGSQEAANAKTAGVPFKPSHTLLAIEQLMSRIPEQLASLREGGAAPSPRGVLRGIVDL